MSSLHNIFNNMSQGPQLGTHGSVEGMIRSLLGNKFINATQQQESADLPISEIQQFPIDQNPTIIQPPVEKKTTKTPKPIEQYCDGCNNPESRCSCENEPDHDEDIDDSDFEIDLEVDDYEDDLPPFQQVLKSGAYKSQEVPKRKEASPKFQNTEGIGLKPKEKVPVKPISKHYPFYRDIDEVFECNVTIEGTMSTATVRLILNTDTWNLVFYGKIKRDGTCLIPIKKLTVLPSGTTGRATLEVVVDDVVFYPWENAFRVEESRKVQVQIKGKSNK